MLEKLILKFKTIMIDSSSIFHNKKKLSDVLEKKVMTLGISSNTHFAFTNAWEYKRITLDTVRFQHGKGLSFKNNQVVVDDDDAKLVKVSANVMLNNSDGVSVVAIWRNSTALCDGYIAPVVAGRFETLSLSTVYIDVKKGDSFGLYLCSGNANKDIQIAGNFNTWFNVEIVE